MMLLMGGIESIFFSSLPPPSPLPGKDGHSSVLVLLGFDASADSYSLILTKRTDDVETHKGQVSFPGGFWEEEDQTLLDTALREAYEEVGIEPRDVKVLGALDEVVTRGQIPIQPYVGVITLPYPFRVNEREVARLLLLPLDQLAADGLRWFDVPVGMFSVKSLGILLENELVWGATAKMLEQFRSYLKPFPIK